MIRRCLFAVVVVSLLAACTGNDADETETAVVETTGATTTTTIGPAPDVGYPWWNDRVFYEVFVRSFKDSDGDGIGDFVGLTESLDYLNDGDPDTTDDLGITGIWLMPIFPSPSYHGYDVTDYRTVNSEYGTMSEFEAFLDAAHERGIAVIIDLVINHTSSEHPWFTAALAGDTTFRDWYLWSDTDPGTVGPWGQEVWHESPGGYYFGLFWEGMPDLNVENEDVAAELYDVARFWLDDVGVDGFRLDAVRHLIEDGEVMADTPETVAWLEGFNGYLHEVAPEALVVGEVWSPTLEVAAYVPDGVDIAFEFALAEAGGQAAATEDVEALEAITERVIGAYPDGQFAPFLTNHDMDRVMSVFGGNTDIAKLAAVWLLTSPGVPFVYYGEEVGLEGMKPDERIRTPMPWNDAAPGLGFTTGTPWEPVDAGYVDHNVAGQTDDPSSLLSLYRTLIHLRNDSSALRHGELVEVETGSSQVFAYLRSDGSDHVLVVGNVDAEAVPVTLDLADGPLSGMKDVITVTGPAADPPQITDRGGFLDYHPVDQLPGYGALLLRFTAEEQPEPPATTSTTSTVPEATAGPADIALAEVFLTEYTGGDDLVSPDFQLRADGQDLDLSFELGEETVDDWNGDGAYNLVDLILQQTAFAEAFRVERVVECVAAGDGISCSAVESDIFTRLAGFDPPAVMYTVWVEDGLVTRLEPPAAEPTAEVPSAQMLWSEQFSVFEEWVADTHPERYPDLFTGECCAGDGSNLTFTAANSAEWTELLAEWLPPEG